MRRDGALLTCEDRRRLGSIGGGRVLENEGSVKFGLISPGDKDIFSESRSRDKGSPSDDNGSPSGTEGSKKETRASGTEGGRGRSGRVDGDRGDSRSRSVGRLVGNAGIEESCTESFDSNSNIETISLASTCRS